MSLLSIIAMSCSRGGEVAPQPVANTMKERLQPFGGVVKVVGNGGWELNQVAECSIVPEPNRILLYYSGISDYNYNQVGVLTVQSMDENFNAAKYAQNPIIGKGKGGAPADRSASASCVIQEGGFYYCFALNGYGFPGEDRAIYAYKSADGYNFTDLGVKFTTGNKANIGNVIGYGNTCFVQELGPDGVTYVPKKFNNKYVGNVDIWDGVIWQTVRWESDNIEGPFTMTNICSTLQVAPGKMYGSADWVYSNGKIHCFYHYAPVSYPTFDDSDPNLPTIGGYATSVDNGVTWTVVEQNIIGLDAQPWPTKTDQFADPCVRQINGKVEVMGSFQENEHPLSAQLHKWRFNGTFEQFTTFN